MSNDLIESLSGGELAPYDAGQPLAPHNHGDWANTDVDLLHEHQHAPQQVTLFGWPLPSGTTEQHVMAALDDLARSFDAGMRALNYPPGTIHFAIQFYKDNALKAPHKVTPRHDLKLPGELADDWLAIKFANSLMAHGGSRQQRQGLLDNAIKWLAKVVKQLSKAPEGSGDMPRMAPNSTEAMLNSLSDSDYEKVIKINEQALAKTLDILAAKWGHVFKQNIQIAQDYLSQLPSADQAHFDQFTTGWVHMRNTVEFITEMFNAATGAHSIGNNGASIAKEIAECERCMKTNRKQWLADNALQARYRTLLTIRDGG